MAQGAGCFAADFPTRFKQGKPPWDLNSTFSMASVWSVVNEIFFVFCFFSLREGTARSWGKKFLLDFTLDLEGGVIPSLPP